MSAPDRLTSGPRIEARKRTWAGQCGNPFGVRTVRIGRINSDDSVTILGQYGYFNADEYCQRTMPGTEWRSIDSPAIEIMTGKSKEKWAPSSRLCVITLRDRGVLQGHAIFEFADAIADGDK